MYKLNENPLDCFNWRVPFANVIVEDLGEYPMFKIELEGLYKEGLTIDLDKLNNVSRLIEDRMNRREGDAKMYTNKTYSSYYQYPVPEIKNVIFNPPATIVFWNDGTKTVVKCQNYESFDPEKGITMAFFKKMHGNKGHYFEEIKKWTEKYEYPVQKDAREDSKWHIWYRIGTTGDIHCYEKDYSNYFHAIKMARKIASEAKDAISWTVSKKVPFGTKGDDTEWHYN